MPAAKDDGRAGSQSWDVLKNTSKTASRRDGQVNGPAASAWIHRAVGCGRRTATEVARKTFPRANERRPIRSNRILKTWISKLVRQCLRAGPRRHSDRSHCKKGTEQFL